MDVVAACRFVDDYGFKAIFVLGRDCYKAAKSLAERKQTVILDPELVFWETNERTRKDAKSSSLKFSSRPACPSCSRPKIPVRGVRSETATSGTKQPQPSNMG